MTQESKPVTGQQITPHLKLGEEFYIDDHEDGTKKKYRLIESKVLDKKTFKPLAVIKPVTG